MEERATGTSVNRMFGYAFGAVYVLVGLVGFAVTSGVGFLATRGKDLVIFEVNPLHNVIHLAVGALLIFGASRGTERARGVNTLVGAVYLLTGVLGLFLAGNEDLNILAINQPDNALHFATAALALAIGRLADRGTTPATAARPKVRA